MGIAKNALENITEAHETLLKMDGNYINIGTMHYLSAFRQATQSSTPSNINKELRRIIKHVSGEMPVFLPYTEAGYRAGACHNNVRAHVEANGGGQIYGWMVWALGPIIDFEFHSVWKNTNGDFVDLTPRRDGEATVLFVPDPVRHYDFATNMTWNNRIFFRKTKIWSFSKRGIQTTEERWNTAEW